jgi:hypothetical protein
MAKNKKKPKPRRSVRAAAKERVEKVIHQVKEPLSLLGTLKEEGMANAVLLLGMASSAAGMARQSLRAEAMKPALRELVQSLGFAFREDLERLEARVEELEQKISESEYAQIKDEEE